MRKGQVLSARHVQAVDGVGGSSPRRTPNSARAGSVAWPRRPWPCCFRLIRVDRASCAPADRTACGDVSSTPSRSGCPRACVRRHCRLRSLNARQRRHPPFIIWTVHDPPRRVEHCWWPVAVWRPAGDLGPSLSKETPCTHS